MKKSLLAARGATLAAFIVPILLLVAARVYAQAGDQFSVFLKTLGPFGIAVELVRILGLPGIIFLIWYFDRKQLQGMIDKYKKDMIKMSTLVTKTQEIGKGYARIAEGLNDVIMLNTQAMTKIGDAIETNQFCPMVRLKEVKRARGRVAGA
jgi:hypothetical protein